jgi:hypothetical protein
MYESETTLFLKKFLAENPEVAASRMRLRATWWDRQLNADEQAGFAEAREAKKGYAYFPVPDARRPE